MCPFKRAASPYRKPRARVGATTARAPRQNQTENVCPRGQNRTSSGQLTPCSLQILQLPASYRYVPGDYLFLPLARLVNRPANSSRVIDVTGSWLSDRSGDLLSRYRPFGRYSLICAFQSRLRKVTFTSQQADESHERVASLFAHSDDSRISYLF